MNKTALFIIFLLTSALSVSGQEKGTIKATVADVSTNQLMAGTVLKLTSQADTTKIKYFTTGGDGTTTMENVDYGEYKLTLSFLGYMDSTIVVTLRRPNLNLGRILMQQDAINLDAVFKTGQAMRTSVRGDTVIYNAAAYKVSDDADTEALLAKMPGIRINNGEVEAQGETVKKVFVDGKEYFGEDVNAAIKSLPAEVVQKVEIFNKLSDQAEFSGIDDGDSYKAINLVTSIDPKQISQFGKVYGAWGIDKYYDIGANISFFKEDTRLTVMAMANNINKQNFSINDILGAIESGQGGGRGRGRGGRGGIGEMLVPNQAGVSKPILFSVNYNDKWGKKITTQANYFFTRSENKNTRDTDREYYELNDTTRTYIANSFNRTKNMQHRIGGRFDYKISDRQNLMWRPNVTLQNYKSEGYSSSEMNDLIGDLTEMVNNQENQSNSKRWGYTISNSLVYRLRLGKPGRVITIDASHSMNKNDTKSFTFSNLETSTGIGDELRRDKSLSYSDGYNINASAMYSEPITEFSQLSARYRISYRYSDSDKKVYPWDEINNIFDPEFDQRVSNIYNSGYLVHEIGPGFNRSKNRNTISMRVSYQYSSLDGKQDFPHTSKVKTDFNDVVYFGMLHQNFAGGMSLRFHARSSTNNPSVTQLQDYTDYTNPLFISSGNPDLKPSYNHNFMTHFIKTNSTKGSTFMLMGGVSAQTNYITNSTYIQRGNAVYVLPDGSTLSQGGQYTKPVNVDGYWSVNAATTYGFPLRPIRSNINLFARVRFGETPGIINNLKNYSSNQSYTGGIDIGSNISQNVDFRVAYNTEYYIVNNTINRNGNNEYINHSLAANFKFVLPLSFTFSGNMSFWNYHGITDDYDERYFLCNLAVGKKVFRNKRGEVSVFVNDLFDQNTAFSRNVTSEYIENVKNNIIGRFVGVQFTFNLRSFGQKTSGNGDRDYPGGGPGRPMGPPPGGGMGPGRF